MFHKKNIPPGPSVFSFLSENVSNRLDYYIDLQEIYGDIVKVPSIFRSYLINDPSCLEYILKTNSDNYQKGGMIVLPLKIALGHGLLVNQGEEWRKRRKLASPYFHPKNLPYFVPIIHKYTEKRINTWEKYLSLGESFDIAHEMMAIVYQVAVEAFYHNTAAPEQLNKIIKVIDLENRFSVSGLGLCPWLPTINGFRYRRAKKFMGNYLENIINTRRMSLENKNDLLDIFLHATKADNKTLLSDQEIYDEVKTFLMTGHETTGSGLAWTMYLLAKNPEVQEKIRSEIRAVLADKLPDEEALKNLPFTCMVFEEALRLYPPIWITGRKARQDDNLGNYFIKAKSEVYICPYIMHRHPHYWEDPNSFIPERHNPQQRQQRPKFAFIPFGGGPRICIASHFAMMESVMIIAMIIQRYQLVLDETHLVESVQYISLKPRYGIKVSLRTVKNT